MKRAIFAFLALASVAIAIAQQPLRIKKTEQIAATRGKQWNHPRFSPSGALIYFTDQDGNGIWEYSLRTKQTRRITADRKSGLAFSISEDGKSIVYRRTLGSGRSRRQEVVLMNLARRRASVLASGRDVSAPVFSLNTPVYTLNSKTKGLPPATARAAVAVLGIENTKIALTVGSTKQLLDPYNNGSYVWPALSPDRNRIVAYEMDRGAFVCDLDGTNLVPLGRRNAPSWTRSGNWIVYMDDRDDGHRLLSSDLWAISPDGKVSVQLTTTRQAFELNPDCSPAENKIVCNTADGSIIVLEYEEQQ